LKQADKVREHVQDIEGAQTKEHLLKTSHNLEVELKELMEMTKKRLRDLKDPASQDDLQAAVAMLKITTPIMVASSKVG
jgi:predicted NUDIX family phosphoesterase